MIRLYYVSTAARDLTAEDHEDILAKARKNNKELGVTGLLIVKGEHFAQALEGDEENVMALFEKIEQDERHLRVVRISKNNVSERIFSEWEMGFRDIGSSPTLSQIDLGDPKYVSAPEQLDAVFRHFVNA